MGVTQVSHSVLCSLTAAVICLCVMTRALLFDASPHASVTLLQTSALVCPPQSGRPHGISVCNTSAENLCLSYSWSTVYSICATVALKLQSALGTQKGGPITAQATEAGS